MLFARRNLTTAGDRNVAIEQRAHGGAIQVFELLRAQTPQEGDEAEETQNECGWQEDDDNRHGRARGISRERRKALATTMMDEPDIAAAAINGVTNPNIASGTAMAL